MPSPITSIVIPCYRQAHFLPFAVRSALGQSIRDIEVVIVDDGSPDDPLGNLGDLVQDPRVVFLRQENAGLPAARNAGILASHGRFLNFLDADDWLAPEFCERLVPALESDEALGFAYCDLRRVFEDDAEPSETAKEYSVGRSRRVTSGNILPSLLVGGYFTPNTVLVPRRILDSAGLFDPALGGNADWDLWLRIAAAGYRARYIDEKLAYYRMHGQSMSRDTVHMDETRSRALHKLLRTWPDAVAGGIEELYHAVEEASGLHDWNRSLEEANAWNAQQARNWQTEADRLQVEIGRLASEIGRLQSHIESLQSDAARLHAEIDSQQAEAGRREIEAGNLQIEIERLQAQARLLTAQLRRVPAPARWFLERYPRYVKNSPK